MNTITATLQPQSSSQTPTFNPVKNKTQKKVQPEHKLSLQKQIQRALLLSIAKVAPSAARALTWHHFIRPRKSKSYTIKDLPEGAEVLSLEHNSRRCNSKSLKQNEQTLTGYRWNQNDSTKRVYLVHGWESNVSKLKHFIQPLIKQGYEVIAFDMPAHGQSKQKTSNFQDWMTALEKIVRTYGAADSMIAYSYGSAVTVNMLSKNPELMPKKLSLVAPMLSAKTHIEVFSKVAMLPEYLSESLLEKLEQSTDLNLDNTSVATLIKNFSVDGLVCHDRNDTYIPYDYGQAIAAAWNGAKLYSSRKLGHRHILRNSVIIDKIVDHSVS